MFVKTEKTIQYSSIKDINSILGVVNSMQFALRDKANGLTRSVLK